MTGAPIGGDADVVVKEAKAVKETPKKKVSKNKKKAPKEPTLVPFSALGIQQDGVQTGFKKLGIVEEIPEPKKAIRRSALEIKKAEEADENRKSEQEKEWEIPAFLRFKK